MISRYAVRDPRRHAQRGFSAASPYSIAPLARIIAVSGFALAFIWLVRL